MFLYSRRQGTSPRTLEFYRVYLTPFTTNYNLTSDDINCFLANLSCHNGKDGYYRAIRAFCNWIYRQGYVKENPITKVDPPKITRVILPSLTSEQVEYLIDQAENMRDKAVISLFADSGIRLNELVNIKASNIDWESQTIIIWGKGGKQRKAPFTKRTARLLKELISQNGIGGNIWHLTYWGIISILRRLEQKTGLPCNPHTFRRTFASNLHRSGLDVEHIMRLGGWESLDMVLRYTKSVKFEESLRLYHGMNNLVS
jgi:integrase/recombinase XerC